MKIFICYAKEDYNIATRLYNDLKNIGLNPWIDKHNILVGQKWECEIRKAIQESSYFLALLSSNSLTKKGYVQKELRIALDILDQSPNSEIFLLPILIDNCKPSDENLTCLHWGKLYPSYDEGIKNIIRVLKSDSKIDCSEQNDILPIDSKKVKKYVTNYLFRICSEEKKIDISRKKILIVDDDLGTRECFKEYLSLALNGYQIIACKDGADALSKFNKGEFAFILSDRMMPNIDGVELTNLIAQKDQDVFITMFTGYCGLDPIDFFRNGGLYYSLKPTYLEDMLKIINWAFTFPVSKFKSSLSLFYHDTGEIIYNLQRVSDHLLSILKESANHNDIAYSLLRHKAKQIVLDFVNSIQYGKNIMELLPNILMQLQSIKRLLNSIKATFSSTINIEEYLKNYISEINQVYPEIFFSSTFSIPKEVIKVKFSLNNVLALIVCELIDNAIAAMKDKGNISIKISLLFTIGVLQILVKDNGPGVDEDIRDNMFDEKISSKGVGRGLGLHLVHEAIVRLNGTIKYSYNNGSIFKINIPI